MVEVHVISLPAEAGISGKWIRYPHLVLICMLWCGGAYWGWEVLGQVAEKGKKRERKVEGVIRRGGGFWYVVVFSIFFYFLWF